MKLLGTITGFIQIRGNYLPGDIWQCLETFFIVPKTTDPIDFEPSSKHPGMLKSSRRADKTEEALHLSGEVGTVQTCRPGGSLRVNKCHSYPLPPDCPYRTPENPFIRRFLPTLGSHVPNTEPSAKITTQAMLTRTYYTTGLGIWPRTNRASSCPD